MKNNILLPNEIVIRESIAGKINALSNSTIGGNLILTTHRIIYVAAKRTRIDCIIPLSAISISDEKFDIYSNTPNIVRIKTKAGLTYEFCVKKGEKRNWEENLEKTLSEYTKNIN